MTQMASINRHLLRGERGSLRSSEAGATHPALPAVVLLVCFAVFMAAIAPLNFTSIFHKFFPAPMEQVPHQNAAVWVDKNSGVYYCAGSIMFGKSQGEYMKQVEALDHGYQPALGTYCAGPAWSLPSHHSATKSPSATPAAPPNTFENPNFKPQSRKTPPVGNVSGQL
jgi:hypothetical protein